MMFKIEMHNLNGSLDLEIKKNDDHYLLLVILSASEYLKTPGASWHGKITDEEKLSELAALVRECKNNPSVPIAITILDGMPVQIRLKEANSETELVLKDHFGEEQNEYQLFLKIMTLMDEVILDERLRKYLREFGGQAY